MSKIHRLDFFRGERFARLATVASPSQNINGQGVAILIRNCDVTDCIYVATQVRGDLQLCTRCARAYDEEQRP